MTLRALALSCLIVPSIAFAATPVDLLIRGGTVFTGDGAEGKVADVAIRGDRIVFVGDASREHLRPARTIDAKGLIVAPGFIDPHVHSDDELFSDDAAVRVNAPNLLQGVTTNILGVDGSGKPEVADLFAKAATLKVGTNFATYVGFSPVRQRILGRADRKPTESELAAMKALVDQGMCEGALGFSTGLFYAPQSYASTEEVIALAREAAKYGGIYDSHQRDESSGGPGSIGIEKSVQEFIRISREAGLPAHLAHLKNSGVFSWGKSAEIIGLIETAQAQGQQITADQYPYLASSGSVASILLPRWALDGGREATLARFADAEKAAAIRVEMTKFLAGRGGGKNLRITEKGSPFLGRTLADVAAEWRVSELDAATRLYREGDVEMAIFTINADDARAYMKRPWVMSSSDGSDGHPRKYGSFATLYRTYVVDEKVLTLPQFIRRSTSLTADALRIVDRGRLKVGQFADVAVFDPKSFAPQATYEQPERLAVGMVSVIINGQLALENGKITGALAGRGLPHAPTSQCAAAPARSN